MNAYTMTLAATDTGNIILDRLERALSREGHKPSRCRNGKIDDQAHKAILMAHGEPNHWEVWCLDHLHDAVQNVLRGENVLAMRLLCGAREYKGRLGGYWPRYEAAEAAERFLANIIEGLLPDPRNK